MFAKLSLDKTDYEKGIDDAKTKGKELGQETEKMSAKSVIAWTAIVTAIIAVGKQTIDLIRNTANYADQIYDTAEKWGFATKEIQEFDYWAKMNGTTVESLLTGMRGLVNQAEAGAPAFEKLDVSVKNADGTFKDQRTLFLETIDALNQMEDRTERNALQFEIFGRAGIELGQVISRDKSELEALSQEAEDLGIILSEDTMTMAGDFNDSLDQIKLSFQSIMAEMMAGSPDADKKFGEFLKRIEVLIQKWTPTFANIFIKIVGVTVQSLAQLLPTLLSQLIGVSIDTIFSTNWLKVGWDICVEIAKGLWNGVKELFPKILGKGWLWDKDQEKEVLTTFASASSSLNNYTSNSTSSAIDNSNYSFEVNISSSNYTEQDAKVIADEVIKQIATKKQARG